MIGCAGPCQAFVAQSPVRFYVSLVRDMSLFVQILPIHFALMPMRINPSGGLLLSGDLARANKNAMADQCHGVFILFDGLSAGRRHIP